MLSIRTERDSRNRRPMAGEGGDLPATNCIPHFHTVIPTRCRDLFTVWTAVHVAYYLIVLKNLLLIFNSWGDSGGGQPAQAQV
jgi:hypothetical protein